MSRCPLCPHGPGRTSHGRRSDGHAASLLPGAGDEVVRLDWAGWGCHVPGLGLGSAGGPGKGGSGLGGLPAAVLEQRKSNSELTFGRSINRELC